MSLKYTGMNSLVKIANLVFVIGVWNFDNFGVTLCDSVQNACPYNRQPQAQFCAAEFAVKGKLFSKTKTYIERLGLPDRLQLYITVEKVFKFPAGATDPTGLIMVIDYHNIPVDYWKIDGFYLFTGSMLPGSEWNAEISICDWAVHWSNVTEMQERGLHGTYEKSCECPYRHPQTQFCEAEFAVKGKLFSKTINYPERFGSPDRPQLYITVEKSLKFPTGATDPTGKVMVIDYYNIPVDYWKIDEFYLFTGSMLPGSEWNAKVLNCDWAVLWSNLTKIQKRGLKGRYEKNCECQINSECLLKFGENKCANQARIGLAKEPVINQMACQIDELASSEYGRICYNSDAYCVKASGGGQCRWKFNTDDLFCKTLIPSTSTN